MLFYLETDLDELDGAGLIDTLYTKAGARHVWNHTDASDRSIAGDSTSDYAVEQERFSEKGACSRFGDSS